MALMHRDSRIDAMFRRDCMAAGFAVVVVWLVYGFTFWTMSWAFTEAQIWPLMAVLGLVVVVLNTAAILAMVRHYSEDRTAIYGTDIYYLDRARAARGAKGDAR